MRKALWISWYVFLASIIFVPKSLAANDSVQFGGLKVGACNVQTLDGCKLKRVSLSVSGIDEFQLTGFNAVLVSVGSDSVTVSLFATEKGKVSSELLLKNNGSIVSSVSLNGTGV